MMDQRLRRDPIERLADEFAARYRLGMSPSIAEYSAAYPEYANQIEKLFPAIVMLERYRVLVTATGTEHHI